MSPITIKKLFPIIFILNFISHQTEAGLGGFGGLSVKDLECDELLENPDYKGNRCTIKDITIKRTSYNWYKLTFEELIFINATLPYIPLDFQMEMETFVFLNFSDVKLQFIDKSNFELACNLKYLYLAKNFINIIPSNAFLGTPNLLVLDLSGNEIEVIDKSALKDLSKLIHLDLSHNSIQKISFKEFENLSDLQTLNLGYNEMQVLDVSDIKKHLPKLEWIGLKGSKIECSELFVIGQKLKGDSIQSDVIDSLTGEVTQDADCVKAVMAEMWFD